MKKCNRISAGLLVFAFVLSLLGGIPAVYAADPQSEPMMYTQVTGTYHQTDARSMLEMINSFRTGPDANYTDPDGNLIACPNLSSLTYSYALEEIAMQRAAEVALSHSHTRPNGESCFTAEASNGSKTWGENICAGYNSLAEAQAAFIVWREDGKPYSGQGHRRNMLNADFRSVGVAHIEFNGRHYWAQEFSYYTDSAPQTPALDGSKQVDITVAQSRVSRFENAAADPASVTLQAGQSVALPVVRGKITLTGAFYSPDAIAAIEPRWISSNNTVVSADGSLKALKAGAANLTATVCSQGFTVPVKVETPQTPLKITKQPVDYAGKVGETASFTVSAQGEGLTYQWQWLNKSGIWKDQNYASFKAATLKLGITEARNGYQYRCVVTDENGDKVISNAVRMIVTPTLKITKQPVDYAGKVGETASFTVSAQGEGLTYQWQWLNKSGIWKDQNYASFKAATLKLGITEARNGYQYRCVVTDKNGDKVISNAVRMIVTPTLKITKQPVDYAGKVGETASFTVSAQGEGLTYQWQWLNKSGVWKDQNYASFKAATLKLGITEARNGYQYRCVVTDKNGDKVISNAVRMIVTPTLKITKQPVDYAGKVGETASFTVSAQGEGLTYQWQWLNKSGIWKDQNYASFKVATLKLGITEARNGYQYRCVIKDADGNTVISNPVTMIVI